MRFDTAHPSRASIVTAGLPESSAARRASAAAGNAQVLLLLLSGGDRHTRSRAPRAAEETRGRKRHRAQDRAPAPAGSRRRGGCGRYSGRRSRAASTGCVETAGSGSAASAGIDDQRVIEHRLRLRVGDQAPVSSDGRSMNVTVAPPIAPRTPRESRTSPGRRATDDAKHPAGPGAARAKPIPSGDDARDGEAALRVDATVAPAGEARPFAARTGRATRACASASAGCADAPSNTIRPDTGTPGCSVMTTFAWLRPSTATSAVPHMRIGSASGP